MDWSDENFVVLPEIALPDLSGYWSKWGSTRNDGVFDVEEQDRDHAIYFLQSDVGGPIKIGRTCKDPRWRCAAAQAGYPFGRLRIVGLLRGHRSLETELHERFIALRMHGEWFRPEAVLISFIRALPEWV